MKTPGKPKKILGMEEALKKLPEDQREAAKAAIERAFGDDWDPKAVKAVRPLPDGAKVCPDCGGKLAFHKGATALPPNAGGALEGKMVHFGECRSCEAPFMKEAKS